MAETWKTLTDERVLGIIKECVDELTEMGYKVPKGIKYKTFKSIKCFGMCSYKEKTLVLNEQLLKEEKTPVKTTVMHEFAHFIAGPGTHHGPAWKKVAANIAAKTGLTINRTSAFSTHSSVEEYRNSQMKYFFRCKGCGSTLSYSKKTEFVKTYDHTYINAAGEEKPRWTCRKCHKTFEMVQGKEK